MVRPASVNVQTSEVDALASHRAGLGSLDMLLAKQAISEVLHRYARGVDRKDRDALMSCYWPDAIDEHAGLFTGSPAELGDFIFATVANMTTMHFVGNVLIDFVGEDRAFCESYVSSHHIVEMETGMRELVGAGRYLDHLSRRGGEWRIFRRKAIIEIIRDVPAQVQLPTFGGLQMIGGAFPDDPLYAMRDQVRNSSE